MPNIQVRFRRGSATDHDTTSGGFTGAEGEVTVDTTNDTLRVHDGSTAGGVRLAKYSELGAGGSTDLAATATGTSLTITSSTGTDASVPAATTSAWGAMTDEDKTKLDALVGQNWSIVNASRALNTVYTNNESVNITVNVTMSASGANSAPDLRLQVELIGGTGTYVNIDRFNMSVVSGDQFSVGALIPPGKNYKVIVGSATNLSIGQWAELS